MQPKARSKFQLLSSRAATKRFNQSWSESALFIEACYVINQQEDRAEKARRARSRFSMVWQSWSRSLRRQCDSEDRWWDRRGRAPLWQTAWFWATKFDVQNILTLVQYTNLLVFVRNACQNASDGDKKWADANENELIFDCSMLLLTQHTW